MGVIWDRIEGVCGGSEEGEVCRGCVTPFERSGDGAS
jgi:hypothetical protein